MLQVLKGVKVVDFTVAVAASATVKILHDLGADVICVEPMTGHSSRMSAPHVYDFFGNGLKSLPLNLKDPEGMKIMQTLLKDADVFVSNFRMKALKKLGLSYEDMKKINPRIVHGTIDGYGRKGPLAAAPGYDTMCFWARGGLMRDIAEAGTLVVAPLSIGDVSTGEALAMAICAGLYGREKTGEGCEVTASLYAQALYLNHNAFVETQYGQTYPKSRKTPSRALLNSYQCRDGEWLTINILDFDKDFNNLLTVLELPELIGDPRWTCRPDTMYEKAPELVAILDQAFKKFDRDEIVAKLNAADIANSPVQSTVETMTDPQALENEYVVSYKTKEGKDVVIPTIPVKVGDYAPAPMAAGPDIGQHTAEILGSLGYSDAEIAALVEKKVTRVK